MFDSHDEFSEWFSKDIENHAEKKSALDESECKELHTEPHVTLDPLSLSLSLLDQLSRLHMILKPFMLRRIKKDVEHEMAEKVSHLTTSTHHTLAMPIQKYIIFY